MKQRSAATSTERAGVLAVATACNSLGLIWRDLLQEDVGVDGTIELVVGGSPTGKLVGVQVKAGRSYIRSENSESFCLYPRSDDLLYWRGLSLPLILCVFDPESTNLYWCDVQSYIENRPTDPLGNSKIVFSKRSIVNDTFKDYLESMFDLSVYADEQFQDLRHEMKNNCFKDTGISGSVVVTAEDLFISGLWGLCTKVQFHLTLLTDAIRKQLIEQGNPAVITYDLARASLFPFITGYLNTLTSHNLVSLDTADTNHTLYSKLEWPAFIAPLTLNGRCYIEFLRSESLCGEEVCDHQFLSLRLLPHTQIEVYSSFRMNPNPKFGSYTDVISIRFNRYLDYYHVLHIRRKDSVSSNPTVIANQTIFYFELRDYLEAKLGNVPKDHILCRHQDMAISPLICWLEQFQDMQHPIPVSELDVKPPSQQIGLADELATIMSPGAASFKVSEKVIPDGLLPLANGESLE